MNIHICIHIHTHTFSLSHTYALPPFTLSLSLRRPQAAAQRGDRHAGLLLHRQGVCDRPGDEGRVLAHALVHILQGERGGWGGGGGGVRAMVRFIVNLAVHI